MIDRTRNTIRAWRQSAPTIACTDPRAKRLRVRKLRQACGNPDARKAEEKNRTSEKTAEAEQVKSLAFSLSASLAFRSLSLVLFFGEPIPSQAASRHLRAHDSEALCVRELSSVVAERLLVKISEQVERLNADVGPLKLSLNETPEVFHRVRVNVAMRILDSMVNNRVPILGRKPVVRLQRITEQRAARLDVLLHVLVKFMLLAVRNGESKNLATALYHTESDSFVLAASARNNLFTARPVHVARFSADEGFINFDFARKLRGVLVLHRFANPMKHKPRSLLGQSEVSRDLVTRDPVLAVRDKPHSREPFAQRNRRFVKDSADFNRELFSAFRRAALPDTASLEEHGFLGLTVRALHPFGPALRREVVQRVVGIVEINNRFGQCFGAFHV
jgi:hypothetical protein